MSISQFEIIMACTHTKFFASFIHQFCSVVLAIEVAEDLRKYILEIYGDFLSPDGFVSYRSVFNVKSCDLI